MLQIYIHMGVSVSWVSMYGVSLSKIEHQMWRDHPFIQRNKATERAMVVGVGGYRERGLDKI